MKTKSLEAPADVLHNIFNDMLRTVNFPDNLKLAEITPVFKKKNPLHKASFTKHFSSLYKTDTKTNKWLRK